MDNTPETTLDTRFSDPDAAPTSWADTRRALEAAEVFWISTVRGTGQPHVTPLVAVWLDGALHFSTGAEEQKAGATETVTVKWRARPERSVTSLASGESIGHVTSACRVGLQGSGR
jgi:hypothetical protein